jgi:hypothetical protein
VIHHVVDARPIGGSRLRVRFDDGVEGEVDVRETGPFVGVFAPLASPVYFARVTVNGDFGTVAWPNGADIDPEVLYAKVTGRPTPDWSDPTPAAGRGRQPTRRPTKRRRARR